MLQCNMLPPRVRVDLSSALYRKRHQSSRLPIHRRLHRPVGFEIRTVLQKVTVGAMVALRRHNTTLCRLPTMDGEAGLSSVE